jgi:hypothetical protein
MLFAMEILPKQAATGKRSRFIQLPDAMLLDTEISDTAIRVYGIIVNAYFGHLVDIREERIAERLGRGRTKHAVIAALKQLKEYIKVHRVGRHNVYEVIGRRKATDRGSVIHPSASTNGRAGATDPGGNGRLATTDYPEIGRLDTSERSSEDAAIGRPGTTSVSIRNSKLITNDVVARTKDDNENDETRVTIISKLVGLGLSRGQAEEATHVDLEVAKSWAERGLGGVPSGTRIDHPIAFIAWATKAGVSPAPPRRRCGSDYFERNGIKRTRGGDDRVTLDSVEVSGPSPSPTQSPHRDFTGAGKSEEIPEGERADNIARLAEIVRRGAAGHSLEATA